MKAKVLFVVCLTVVVIVLLTGCVGTTVYEYDKETGALIRKTETKESILEQVAKEVYDQRFVTIARMRVFGDEKATLQQCGEALGVTRERARQIFDVDIPILRKIMSKELGCEWREPSE